MKKMKILLCLSTLFSFVFFNQGVKAQIKDKKQVVVEMIIKDSKGKSIKKTIVKEGEEILSVHIEDEGVEWREEMILLEGKDVDLDVQQLRDKLWIKRKYGENDESYEYIFNGIDSEETEVDGYKKTVFDGLEDNSNNIACDRPFLGVMVEDHHKGLYVKDVFATTGADKAGLQRGDILIEIDGIELDNIPMLSKRLSDLEAGSKVELAVMRNDQLISTSAVLQDREANDMWVGKYKKYWIAVRERVDESETMEKAYMGVYLNDTDESVIISGTSEYGASRSAGLQSQDILVSIGGKNVSTSEEVSLLLSEFEPGQIVNVNVIRDGVTLQYPVTLGSKKMHRIDWKGCNQEDSVEEQEDLMFIFIRKEVSTIPNPPTAPGPPTPPTPLPTPPPAPPAPPAPQPAEADFTSVQVSEDFFTESFELELEDVSIFPNPTSDFVNVSFRANNQPIKITITDALGRMIYDRSIDRFDGFFAEQIDLTTAAPGVAFLNVIQGDKKASVQIVRAK